MRATVFIVHPNDGLLRTIAALLEAERYQLRSAEVLEPLLEDVRSAPRPAVLLVDEDAAGPRFREQLESVPADVPCVLLTWDSRSSFPPGVTLLLKPFGARELLETLAEKVARREGPPAGRR